MNKIYITATDAREKFFDLVENSQKKSQPVHITVRGIPKAVIMSQEDYDGWAETYETLADTKLMTSVSEGLKDIKKGDLVDWKTLKQRLDKS